MRYRQTQGRKLIIRVQQLTYCVAVLLAFAANIDMPGSANAADWPMWRHDARRSAATPEQLPDVLSLLWVNEFPPQAAAWPDQVEQGYLSFDVSYKPVVLGKRMFVGSAVNDRLTALNTETGEELWRYYADAPIRFAPVAWKDKVAFAGDDGWLTCLNATDGSVAWRYRGGLDDRKILGNERLVSLWPIRGGPVLADGTIYFGASIWPFVGTFLHAVDAETGKAVWVNSGLTDFKPAFSLQGTGLLVRPGFHGCVPQGYLTAVENFLAVPQGRNVSQLFDRTTGTLIFHEIYGMHEEHDPADQWFALTAARRVFSGPLGSRGINLQTGQMADGNQLGYGVTDEQAVYRVTADAVSALNAATLEPIWQFRLSIPAKPTCPGSYIKAGRNLYLPGAAGEVLIIKNVDSPNRSLVVGPKIPGNETWDMLAADGKLFVVTRDGQIACFGEAQTTVRFFKNKPAPLEVADGGASAAEVLASAQQTEGYALVLGIKDGILAKGLLEKSRLQVIAVDKDPQKILSLRRDVDASGQYGSRFSAHAGDPLSFGFPPYLANLIVSETPDDPVFQSEPAKAELLHITRPYGGTIWMTGERVIRREALKGAADWTVNNADAGNSMIGHDSLVKPPLGVLWFGGPPNSPMLPRHGRGPTPEVAGGRAIILGVNLIRALDIYTGRLLWEAPFPNIGQFYDTGAKQMGTHETGPNYASTPDAVYVITPEKCVALEATTGKQFMDISPPADAAKDSLWATVRVDEDLLVATIRPLDVKRDFGDNTRVGAGAKWLAAFDRKTGKCLWSRPAVYGWRSNGVAVCRGNVYAIDGLAPSEMDRLKRRGATDAARCCLYGIDGHSGKELWTTNNDIFGTWLGYSADHDVLIQGGAGGDDAKALAAHRAADGVRLWRCPPEAKAADPAAPSFLGPPMIHRDVIIPQLGQVIGITDGQLRTTSDPLTGKQVPWQMVPNGCGFTHGGEEMLFHRAWSTAGYTEIKNAPRVTGLGGFRSGCTANLVPAGGVVTAPEYSRECNCQFQNKTSIGLIHMPDAEQWSYDSLSAEPKGRIVRVGLNFGAPGDRISDEGTLWLDCPDIGGPSQQLKVEFAPNKAGERWDWRGNWRNGAVPTNVFSGTAFAMYPALIKSGPLPWVTASGLQGVTRIKVGMFYPLGTTESASYTVRLYFAEPDENAKSGDRVFDISLQGKKVLADFDITQSAGGSRRGIMKSFTDIHATDSLLVEFSSRTGEPLICGLEAIAQP